MIQFYISNANEFLNAKFLYIYLFRRIVTFYYNLVQFDCNTLKYSKNMSINNIETQNLLRIIDNFKSSDVGLTY